MIAPKTALAMLRAILAGELWLSLHESAEIKGADQTFAELSYAGYSRARIDPADWDIQLINDEDALAIMRKDVAFAEVSSGAPTIGYWALGTSASGPGDRIWSGAFERAAELLPGTTPRVDSGTITLVLTPAGD